MTGTAEGLGEKSATKCMPYVSSLCAMGSVKLGKALILSSTSLLAFHAGVRTPHYPLDNGNGRLTR